MPCQPRRSNKGQHMCRTHWPSFQSASVSLSPSLAPARCNLSASCCPVATPVRRQSQRGTTLGKARATPTTPSGVNNNKQHTAITAQNGQATTWRLIWRRWPRDGPHHALGRGPVAAAGAVAAAGSGGLPASLTSGAGEADGNKTLCCMALTFLWIDGREAGAERGP